MRYLFGFVCVCALGMAASMGCSEPEINLCETVGNCEAQDHSCNPGDELYCKFEGEGAGVCACRSMGTGGTGGSGGSGGTGGSGGDGATGGTGGSVECDGGVARQESQSFGVACTPPDAGPCSDCNDLCLQNGLDLGSLGEQCVDEPPFGSVISPVCVCDCAYCQPL